MPSVQISDKQDNGWSFIDAKETKREKKRRKKDEASTKLLQSIGFEPTLGKQPPLSPEPADEVPKMDKQNPSVVEMAKAAWEKAKKEMGPAEKKWDGKKSDDPRPAESGGSCRPM